MIQLKALCIFLVTKWIDGIFCHLKLDFTKYLEDQEDAIFREINLAISLAETLLSRKFCKKKSVGVNFRKTHVFPRNFCIEIVKRNCFYNFHTVTCDTTTPTNHSLEVMLFSFHLHINFPIVFIFAMPGKRHDSGPSRLPNRYVLTIDDTYKCSVIQVGTINSAINIVL